MPRVYIGVGSNHQRAYNIQAAVRELGACFGALTLSSVYESRAVGSAQGHFYNLVIGLNTTIPLAALRQRLHQIEQACGRVRGGTSGGRYPLDLDLLLYGDYVGPVNDRFVPRPDIEQYAFVLCPLAEIAGEARHPQRGERYRTLWQRFDKRRQPLRRVPLALDDVAARPQRAHPRRVGLTQVVGAAG
ncbi:2-amino-4-hydroxy-6-hydroxymethyldihydropteridine diphosphokinase [Sedimenticola hydrogenitrophicus]|uniref:2-amino-4-hydroxy-6- hydroxymethyldihydropteridine diphosphokinase n=1 Tax=Sedimenticola hydrogenitrophicus TaxID=2967975 RepID=UPI0023B0D874|nr:2-amino-4-hydroxy-6-hydroxymethyldihydropteridine diphosphokinase [Sedimenticola hydrogenitrophicus]